MNWTFVINPDTDNLEIDEPVGWSDASIEIVRDKKTHGVSVAYAVNELRLDGRAAQIVEDEYEANLIDGDVKIKVILDCTPEVYEETFQLDFGTYEKVCGAQCYVKIGFEQVSCFQKFNANYDKKVDVETPYTFDTITPVRMLPDLKKTISLPAKAILKTIDANVANEKDIVEYDQPAQTIHIAMRPTFLNVRYEAIQTSQVSNPAAIFSVGDDEDEIVSPVLLYEDNPQCMDGTVEVNLRMKGKVELKKDSGVPGYITLLTAIFIKAKGSYQSGQPYTTLAQVVLNQGTEVTTDWKSWSFDLNYSNPSLVMEEGDTIYMLVHFSGLSFSWHPRMKTTFDPETMVYIAARSVCPPTDGELFLPFETLSRVTDVITDGCMVLDSEYYGRTDSAVAYGNDGCGAFRSLTTGLHLRNTPDRRFFTTMKDLFEGLQAIDCTGMRLERDASGFEKLVIEPVEDFYRDVEVLRLEGIQKVSTKALPGECIGSIITGYDKWQAEKINGMDEFNSTREYRTELENAKTKFEITSKLIAAGYIIESARIQNYAASGAADTKYDNDTFVIQLERSGPDLVVEQGIDVGGAGVFDPATVYNFRLSPVRNLMRWFRWLAGFSMSKFIFGSGTGNYLAEGQMLGTCSPELGIIKENQDIIAADLSTTTYRTPLVKPESVTFEYPLSASEFGALRTNPYGYISYECDGIWKKAYVFKVTHKIKNGMATFDLRSKYE